jgi:tetratricopeptide (TPR) repeat protein
MAEDPIERACALHERSVELRAAGKPLLAWRKAKAAVALLEVSEGPAHPDVANVLLALGAADHDLGRFPAALAHARRASDIMLGTKSRSLDVVRLRVQALSAVAWELIAVGKYEEARAPALRAVRHADKRLGAEDVAQALNIVGVIGKYTGRWDDAERCYRRALALIGRVEGSEHFVATLLHNIGGLEHARGRFARAEAPQRRGLSLRERALGPNHVDVAADAAALAAILDGRKKYDEARALYRRALRIYSRALGPGHFEVGFNLGNLAALCHGTGELASASRLYVRAIRIKTKSIGPRHPDLASTIANFAALRVEQGRIAEAEKLYRNALAMFDSTVGSDHPDRVRCQKSWIASSRSSRVRRS